MKIRSSKDRVLAYLLRLGSATNVELNHVTVGGQEGTRRLRELRADGWIITKTHVKGGVYRYTLG